MQPDWSLFRAMLHCPYKAWQLIKENKKEEPASFPGNPVLPDKIALAAAHYETQKPTKHVTRVEKLLTDFKVLTDKKDAPAFYKNAHCSSCGFWKSCQQKLKEKDCISLLPAMTPKTLSRYHSKGIFSILQLSHLFRLRRKRNRPQTSGSYLWELKALAIREKKTYVLQAPDMKSSAVSIFIDFEGLPEDDFIYLIGVIIQQQDQTDQHFSYWTDFKEQESNIFDQLFQLVMKYPEANIFHYGSYELKALKKWKKICPVPLASMESRMVNVLGYFRTHVYPPNYTNGLKEIAGHLGFQWQDPEADGLLSMEWRRQYQNTGGEKWKDKLIQYNLDDCRALMKVQEWLMQLSSENNNDSVQQVSKMKKHSPYRLQNNTDYSDDFTTINKAAYFDYQRSKIYWRSGKPILKKKKTVKHYGRGIMIWQPKRINEIILAPPLKRCPHCGHGKIYHSEKKRTFIQTDLKFTSRGIKQWIIEYQSGRGKCAACAKKHNDSVLKQMRYGDNLLAWAINLYVNYHISFASISRLLQEQFGVWANPTYFNERMYYWWQQFKPLAQNCWQTILSSPVVHIDETTVRLAKGKERGYVWAFATSTTVFYHLTLNREAGFLHEWLKDYHGVIVTDFFAGYDGLPVKQQKCLIHLIRDLNDDLFKHTFDEEFKSMVVSFGQLLKSIVLTIDKYGLKKRHLHKHLKDCQRYYTSMLETEHSSELSVKYVKRLKKQWNQLWTFLEHDDVPWNNNNAEAAIKAFAQHRRHANGIVSEGGLKEYLSMLTVAQTCRYRELSFLEVLREKRLPAMR